MQLQQFVTKIIEEFGGIVEPIEYALCNVLIPDKYASFFQNKSEIVLAFDFEVAQENPHAEFVTFGSYIFEQVLLIVQEKALSTLRFAEVERLELGNPMKKLNELYVNESGRLAIIDEKPVMGVWAVFQYEINYLAEDKIATSDQVWVNLLTNKISDTMKEEQRRIIYQDEALYSYPVTANLDLSIPLQVATEYAQNQARKLAEQETKTGALEQDIKRITEYYHELLNENDKRAKRAGLSEEKKQEILAKSTAIKLEREKQLQEIYNKYKGQTEVNLDNSILYFIPLIQYTIAIDFRNETTKKTAYFNPITRQIFEQS